MIIFWNVKSTKNKKKNFSVEKKFEIVFSKHFKTFFK